MPRPGTSKRRPSADRSRIQWRGFTDTPNVRADKRHQRYYKSETFQNALAKVVNAGDFLIAPAVEALAPGAEIASIKFDLLREYEHALIFAGLVTLRGKKNLPIRLLAAKDDDKHTATLRHTARALAHAHERAPQHTLRLLSSGNLYLPDRHRRIEKGREILCCVTSFLPDSFPLCVARGGRLAVVLRAPELLGIAEEENARIGLIELAARLYDAKNQTGILLPDLARDQIEILRKRKTPQVVVSLPDGLRTRLTVPRFIHELASWTASGAGSTLRVRPNDLDDFIAALSAGAGEAVAHDWLSRYKRSVMDRKLPVIPPLVPADLVAAGIQ